MTCYIQEHTFNENVMEPMFQSFHFGSHELGEFRYVGMNMKQDEGVIVIHHDHYIEALEMPDVTKYKHLKNEDKLDEDGQSTDPL